MSAKGGPVFTFSLPGGTARPLVPHQLRHWWYTRRLKFEMHGNPLSAQHTHFVISDVLQF